MRSRGEPSHLRLREEPAARVRIGRTTECDYSAQHTPRKCLRSALVGPRTTLLPIERSVRINLARPPINRHLETVRRQDLVIARFRYEPGELGKEPRIVQ